MAIGGDEVRVEITVVNTAAFLAMEALSSGLMVMMGREVGFGE